MGLLALSGGLIASCAIAGSTTAFSVYAPSGGVRAFALTRIPARYGERLSAHAISLEWLIRLRRKLFVDLAALPSPRSGGSHPARYLTGRWPTATRWSKHCPAPPAAARRTDRGSRRIHRTTNVWPIREELSHATVIAAIHDRHRSQDEGPVGTPRANHPGEQTVGVMTTHPMRGQPHKRADIGGLVIT